MIKPQQISNIHHQSDSAYQSAASSSSDDDETESRGVTSKVAFESPSVSARHMDGKEHFDGGIVTAISATLSFFLAVAFFICGGSFDTCPFFRTSPHAKAQVYSLVTILWMWDRPHYRAGTYQDDMLTNLRNVAIPGTGIPLSFLVRSKILSFLFLLVGYPIVCIIAGLRKGGFNVKGATKAYAEQLLCPQDWFSFWRLNCVVASYHGQVNTVPGFKQEDKWTFLTDAKAADIPVSPWLDVECIVAKDKNEEGGMGIHFFKNAVHGGQWILQTKLSNGGKVAELLPADAPLSTLRVITASRGGMRKGASGESAPLAGAPQKGDVQALSCVFRAGRAGASTDHNSILFDMDLATGKIRKGTTNMHWYQLGPSKVATTPWICLDHTITEHPDSGARITGHTIPDIEGIRELCENAHFKLLPDVPLAGWDVAITKEAGMCLLEVNLSCNFFRGTFDQKEYFKFCNEYFSFLDKASRS